MSEIDWLDDEEERGIESNKEGARAMTDDKLIEAAKRISNYCRTQKCNKKCDYWDDIDEYCLVAQKIFGDVVKPKDWYLRKDK